MRLAPNLRQIAGMDSVSPLIDVKIAETLAKQRGFECQVIAGRLCVFHNGDIAAKGTTLVDETDGMQRVSRHAVERIIGIGP